MLHLSMNVVEYRLNWYSQNTLVGCFIFYIDIIDVKKYVSKVSRLRKKLVCL